MFKDLTPEEMIDALLTKIDNNKIGLIKFEIETTTQATELNGYKSKFYKDLEKDFTEESKKLIEDKISKVSKELTELQKLISKTIEEDIE